MFTISGLNHLALVVEEMAVARHWFNECLGFPILEDRGELIILGVGKDLLAIKTKTHAINKPETGTADSRLNNANVGWQVLDHYGFFAGSEKEVNAFAEKLPSWGAQVLKGPYSRSDGHSVYFRDPCGNVGEYFFYRSPK